MQTLQQELDPAVHGLTAATHPALRELMADPAHAYAEEVRVLRQRVALLEAELAATKAAQVVETRVPLTAIDFAPSQRTPMAMASVFTEPLMPAVMAFDAQPAPAPAAEPVLAAATASPTQPALTKNSVPSTAANVPSELTEAAVPVPNPGFAQAWDAEEPDASFEERVAERAFFQASTVDEESRTWLLAQ